jgi:hypothetical protein
MMSDISDKIDQQINSYDDWRGDLLKRLRKLIHETDPEIQEEWKWDVPVFTKNGMVCAISAFKDHVKINFFKGSQLKDPHKLINAGLESKKNKAIDFAEGDQLDETKLKDLIKEAVALNS